MAIKLQILYVFCLPSHSHLFSAHAQTISICSSVVLSWYHLYQTSLSASPMVLCAVAAYHTSILPSSLMFIPIIPHFVFVICHVTLPEILPLYSDMPPVAKCTKTTPLLNFNIGCVHSENHLVLLTVDVQQNIQELWWGKLPEIVTLKWMSTSPNIKCGTFPTMMHIWCKLNKRAMTHTYYKQRRITQENQAQTALYTLS